MDETLKIHIRSANKQNAELVSTKCIDFLKSVSHLHRKYYKLHFYPVMRITKGGKRKVILIAKSSAISKAITVSEIVKLEIPNVSQYNSLVNLEVSVKLTVMLKLTESRMKAKIEGEILR